MNEEIAWQITWSKAGITLPKGKIPESIKVCGSRSDDPKKLFLQQ